MRTEIRVEEDGMKTFIGEIFLLRDGGDFQQHLDL